MTARLDNLEDDVKELFTAVNNCVSDSTDACLAKIRDEGVRFGQDWWVGSQGDYLFAINVAETSYYKFEPARNVTL